MSTTPHQPKRDDDLLLAAEADGAAPRPLPEAPEGSHPRIPESVARRLRDRSAGAEFDPRAIRSSSTSDGVAEPASDSEQVADEQRSSSRPTPVGAQDARPTRRNRMAQLPAEERRERPTALSGGLPSGKGRTAEDDAKPAPWGRLTPQSGPEQGTAPALGAPALGAPAPKPVSAADMEPGVPSASVQGDATGAGEPASDEAAAHAPAQRDAFTTLRIVLGVVLLLLVIALILLLVL